MAHQELSLPGAQATNPQVAVDAAGNAIALWTRYEGGSKRVQAAVRPVGGPWGGPESLSAAGRDADQPQVAFDAQGNALAVWHRSNGSNNVVQAAFRPVGGPWGDPLDLTDGVREDRAAQVAFDAAGNATVVWSGYDGSNHLITTRVRSTAGAWSAEEYLSATGASAFGPALAVGPDGHAIVAWMRSDGTNDRIQGSVRSTSGAWAPAVNLSAAGQDAEGPRVAVPSPSDAIAVWHRDDGTNPVVQAAFYASGDWQTAEDVSEAGVYTEGVSIGADGSGNVLALYDSGGTTDAVQITAAFRPAGGDWAAPEPVSSVGKNGSSALALRSGGVAMAIWHSGNEGERIVRSALRPPGGAWASGPDVSPANGNNFNPRVAFDGSGNAIAAWPYSNATENGIIRAAGYDATAPVLRNVNVPTPGFARQRLTFSLDAFDAWSALAPPVWNFGDGKSASGQTVTHTFARGGTYTVGVTQPDAVGNSSSTTRLLTLRVARCFGKAATRVGSGGPDRIVGTRRDDVIVTVGGNDRVRGRGGNDRICGGAGRDRIAGGAGNDLLNGGPGRDFCRQGPGRGRLVSC